jgi:hypothetical protein
MRGPLNVEFKYQVCSASDIQGVGRKEACVGSFRRGKPEGNSQLERYLRRYEGSIKTGPKEIGREGLGSVHLTQDRHS